MSKFRTATEQASYQAPRHADVRNPPGQIGGTDYAQIRQSLDWRNNLLEDESRLMVDEMIIPLVNNSTPLEPSWLDYVPRQVSQPPLYDIKNYAGNSRHEFTCFVYDSILAFVNKIDNRITRAQQITSALLLLKVIDPEHLLDIEYVLRTEHDINVQA